MKPVKTLTFEEVLAAAKKQKPLTDQELQEAMELFAKAGGGIVVSSAGVKRVPPARKKPLDPKG